MDLDDFVRQSQELARTQAEFQNGQAGPTPMLSGEDPGSDDAADIERWVEVYTELASFKQQLIDEMHDRLAVTDLPPVRQEMEKDERVWRLESERIALHLHFWTERRREVLG